MSTVWSLIGTIPLLATLLGLVLWFVHVHFWRWRLSTAPVYESADTLRLPDGGVVDLRRVGAPVHGGPQGERTEVPVLMIHGLAMNHRNHDAHEQYSFARYLHRRGRDVWLVTLRSGRRSRALFGAPKTDFASMVKHDLPGAVHAVLARTGQRQLDLATFSMGGMLLYAGLGRTLHPGLVRRVAVFASPAKVRSLGALRLSSILPSALAPGAALRTLLATIAFAPRLVPGFLLRRLYNPENVDRRIERGMLCDVWENIPGRLGADFVRWSVQGGEITVDGLAVLGGLAKIAVPACFFAGSADWLAPEHAVRAGYDAWGCDVADIQKHLVVLGRAHGTTFDYGHCDIAFGRHVCEEVFAPAARFLDDGVLPLPRQVAAAEPTKTLKAAFEDVAAAPAE